MSRSEPIGSRRKPTAQQSKPIDVVGMPWQKTKIPGIQIKVLYRNEETGQSTILFKFAPGAKTPLHEHTALEQTFVLEGSLVDHDGEVTAGNYVWREPGSVHQAYAPNGSLHIAFFGGHNRMLEGPDATALFEDPDNEEGSK